MKTILTAIVLITIATLGIYSLANADTLESIEAQVNYHLSESARHEAEANLIISEIFRHQSEFNPLWIKSEELNKQWANHFTKIKFSVSMRVEFNRYLKEGKSHKNKSLQHRDEFQEHTEKIPNLLEINQLTKAEHHLTEAEHHYAEGYNHYYKSKRLKDEIDLIIIKAEYLNESDAINEFVRINSEFNNIKDESDYHSQEIDRLTIEALRHQIKSKQHLAEATRIAEEVMTLEDEILEKQGIRH